MAKAIAYLISTFAEFFPQAVKLCPFKAPS